jgi:hypothetical protein
MSFLQRLFSKKQPRMSEEVFWDIVEKFDWDKTGDDDAVIGPAVDALAQMSTEEILQFEDILAEKLHALDGEKYACEIGESAYRGPDQHFSTDWFLYARCCVVANGRWFYNGVLSNPEKMPKDLEFEALLMVARLAYQRRTGEEFNYLPKVSYETFSNKAGWSQEGPA